MTASDRVDAARLDEWQRLADEATPGPWGVVLGDEVVSQPFNVTRGSASFKRRIAHLDEYDYEVDEDDDGWDDEPGELSADAAFIAASREAVPLLVAEVRRLRAQVEALTSALERTERNFKLAVDGKPVRDMCENLAENVAALSAGDGEVRDA